MAVVRRNVVERKLKALDENCQFVIETLASASEYSTDRGDIDFIGASVKRQISIYLHHLYKSTEEQIIAEIAEMPYKKGDDPERRRNAKNKKSKAN
jgi:hypothetical protein